MKTDNEVRLLTTKIMHAGQLRNERDPILDFQDTLDNKPLFPSGGNFNFGFLQRRLPFNGFGFSDFVC
ncbi:MAG: hypothetical protein K8H86_03940 [Ignavibacteriaceae bacterium]|nr:hypothetical protein [Ignavibacteriaceae bacterium]